MYTLNLLFKCKNTWLNLLSATNIIKSQEKISRTYAKNYDDGCRKAIVDMPVPPECPGDCKRRPMKKPSILHKIKLKLIEGGSNFGSRGVPNRSGVPPRRPSPPPAPAAPEPPPSGTVRLAHSHNLSRGVSYISPLVRALMACLARKIEKIERCITTGHESEARGGCSCFIAQIDAVAYSGAVYARALQPRLRLYESKECQNINCHINLNQVAIDLQTIDTNCVVQAFSSEHGELERCLQNSDIVLMLESGCTSVDMPFEKRFACQAPLVKHYADSIAVECPTAFIIVCASPIDCMVPLVAETLKETGWYNPRKLLGSVAVPEMRASTLAARALCLEPIYTKVPCVGGTEGETLVPLFSKAVEYFEFAEHNALLMIDAVRQAPVAVTRTDGDCVKAGDLSEAHAISKLVMSVANALLCKDVPRVSGFVETDAAHVVSPARYLATEMTLNCKGIREKFDFPCQMNSIEKEMLDSAFMYIKYNVELAQCWHAKALEKQRVTNNSRALLNCLNKPTYVPRLKDCVSELHE